MDEEQRCHIAICHHLSRVVFSGVHQLFKMESFIKHVRECGVWQHNDEQDEILQRVHILRVNIH
jgi:hypothetical protein